MKALRLSSCVLVLLVSCSALSTALKCGSGELPFPFGVCLEFVSTSDKTNLDAHTGCQSTVGSGLVTVEQSEQFESLQRYVELLANEGDFYWLGYYFNDSQTVLTRSGQIVPPDSAILENYDPGAVAGSDMCIAMGQDGLLYTRRCTDTLPYICAQQLTAPQITSISTGPTSRFFANARDLNLTCTFSNGDFTWRKNGEPQPSATDPILTFEFGSAFVGQYDCVVENDFGAVVSQAIVLVEGTGSDMDAPSVQPITISSDPVRFGTQTTFTCDYTFPNDTTMGNVEWYINGALADSTTVSTGMTQSTLTIERFRVEGVYQCRVFNDNGENTVQSVTVNALSGTPGPVNPVVAIENTKTEAQILWTYPPDINVHHPLLLRYQLLFHTGNQFVIDDATTPMSPVLPTMDSAGEYSFTLSGLSAGTEYVSTLRAGSPSAMGQEYTSQAGFTTYGNAPSQPIKDLSGFRTLDNKTIFANWTLIKTSLPTGTVTLYAVEYRNAGKDHINGLTVSSGFNYAVIAPVANANEYEIRVRACVQVARDPPEIECNEWSEWEKIDGVVPTVPPVPPTGGLLDRPGEIVAIVVSVVCVVALVVLVIVAGVICLVLKKREANRPERLRTQSLSSDTKAVNMSALNEEETDIEKQPY